MDVGTNSVRLLVVEITANRSYKILRKEKEMVRLGEREFADNVLQPEAMARAVVVCAKFAELAKTFKVEDILVVATSATREADNQSEFVAQLAAEAGLDVRVVSGLEEARLIYLGVSRSIHLGVDKALFIDIGGGSTELILGDGERYEYLTSLQLGAVRLTNLFFSPEDNAAVGEKKYAEIRQHVYNRAIRAIQQLRKAENLKLAIGSSGTIENLADIAVRMTQGRTRTRDDVLTRRDLTKVIKHLREIPLGKRSKVAGINPQRADIIVAGAAIIDLLMDELQLEQLLISDRGLQDGLLVDYLSARKHDLHARPFTVRERQILNLGRACHFDEGHARHVTKLSLDLFDTSRKAGLHNLGDWERELLQYAAILHDVGMFLSYPNHEFHASYIIRNTELLGFDQTEIDIMAGTALFHRKRPRKRYSEYAEMDKRSRDIVRTLSMLLRMAESLDRGHTGAVESADLAVDNGRAVLTLRSKQDCQLEEWNLQQHLSSFERQFLKRLQVRTTPPEPN
jgi:exopolyphosphatase/guanosine-5'-triphosphate,3'-diphosphate pyrophosphatase